MAYVRLDIKTTIKYLQAFAYIFLVLLISILNIWLYTGQARNKDFTNNKLSNLAPLNGQVYIAESNNALYALDKNFQWQKQISLPSNFYNVQLISNSKILYLLGEGKKIISLTESQQEQVLYKLTENTLLQDSHPVLSYKYFKGDVLKSTDDERKIPFDSLQGGSVQNFDFESVKTISGDHHYMKSQPVRAFYEIDQKLFAKTDEKIFEYQSQPKTWLLIFDTTNMYHVSSHVLIFDLSGDSKQLFISLSNGKIFKLTWNLPPNDISHHDYLKEGNGIDDITPHDFLSTEPSLVFLNNVLFVHYGSLLKESRFFRYQDGQWNTIQGL